MAGLRYPGQLMTGRLRGPLVATATAARVAAALVVAAGLFGVPRRLRVRLVLIRGVSLMPAFPLSAAQYRAHPIGEMPS